LFTNAYVACIMRICVVQVYFEDGISMVQSLYSAVTRFMVYIQINELSYSLSVYSICYQSLRANVYIHVFKPFISFSRYHWRRQLRNTGPVPPRLPTMFFSPFRSYTKSITVNSIWSPILYRFENA